GGPPRARRGTGTDRWRRLRSLGNAAACAARGRARPSIGRQARWQAPARRAGQRASDPRRARPPPASWPANTVLPLRGQRAPSTSPAPPAVTLPNPRAQRYCVAATRPRIAGSDQAPDGNAVESIVNRGFAGPAARYAGVTQAGVPYSASPAPRPGASPVRASEGIPRRPRSWLATRRSSDSTSATRVTGDDSAARTGGGSAIRIGSATT